MRSQRGAEGIGEIGLGVAGEHANWRASAAGCGGRRAPARSGSRGSAKSRARRSPARPPRRSRAVTGSPSRSSGEVRLRPPQAERVDEDEEALLERAPRLGRTDVVGGEDRSESGGRPGAHLRERARRECSTRSKVRSVNARSHARSRTAAVDRRREVQEGARNRSAGDGIHVRCVTAEEAAGAVNANARARARVARDRHVHVRGRGLAQAVEGCRRRMRERRPLVGKCGGHPPAVQGDRGVADCVHPSVDRVQHAAGHAVSDTRCGQTQRHELSQRDHPVLRCGDGRDARVEACIGGSVPIRDASCNTQRHRPRIRPAPSPINADPCRDSRARRAAHAASGSAAGAAARENSIASVLELGRSAARRCRARSSGAAATAASSPASGTGRSSAARSRR